MFATDIAFYLQTVGEGTIGQDLFVDVLPDDPINAVVVYDLGGQGLIEEPPELWREIFIQVRNTDHGPGSSKIWSILNYLLYPTTTYISVSSNLYTAELKEIPSIHDRDRNGNYLFGFSVILRKVVEVQDAWMSALANWTSQILGPDWTVYKSFAGNQKPSVTWELDTFRVMDGNASWFVVEKRFTAKVVSDDPNEQISGTTLLVERLVSDLKILLDQQNKRYLRVVSADGDLTVVGAHTGRLSVTLSARTSRPTVEAPIISGINLESDITQ